MKDDLANEGWYFPTLELNMRNQINISSINVDFKHNKSGWQIKSSIDKLKSGSNIVGEVPLLVRIDSKVVRVHTKKVLGHYIKEMKKKDDKNIVILYDQDSLLNWSSLYESVTDRFDGVIDGEIIVEYPYKSASGRGFPKTQNPTPAGTTSLLTDRQRELLSIKDFIEKQNHILITHIKYFKGCEASNVIFLNWTYQGVRDGILRAVKNLICIQPERGITIDGMKVVEEGYASRLWR